MDKEDPSGGQNRIHRGPWLWQSLPGAEQGVTWPPKEQGGHAEQDFTCSPFSLFQALSAVFPCLTHH